MEEIRPEHGKWGIRMNIHSLDLSRYGTRFSSSKDGCPDWANKWQAGEYGKSGLIVWDNEAHRLECFNAQAALHLLETLRASNVWKKKGVVICQYGAKMTFPIEPSTKSAKQANKGKKTTEKHHSDQNNGFSWIEVMKLPTDAGAPLLAMLETHESALLEMSKREEDEASAALLNVYKILLRGAKRAEAEKVDLSQRGFAWSRVADENKFVCCVPPARTTVRLHTEGDSWPLWAVDLEVPDQPVLTSKGHFELTSALELAEKWLTPNPKTQIDRPSKKPDEEWAKELKREYGKRWIDVGQIDTVKPVYAVIIELYHAPLNGKRIPISFGATKLVGDKYPTETELLSALNLPQGQFELARPVGILNDWFLLNSITAFLKKASAMSEAQRIWNASFVNQGLREGKIIRARYGVVEKAIQYCTWIGECGEPYEPWSETRTRRAHLLHMAVHATLISTLDVQRFRAFLGLQTDLIADNQLLRSMHQQRSNLECLSVEERAKSAVWLVKNKAAPQDAETRVKRTAKSRRK
jgi:hypothetical protein